MSKYTPGPWSHGHYEDGRRVIHTAYLSHHDCIAELPVAPNDLANARLIAAAPEMLDALRTLTALIPPFNPDWNPVLADEVSKARAAIAKATGGDA